MTTVIAFANQKGGVGKTTFAVQFAYWLKIRKHKSVLFLDMDAQASASETLLEGAALVSTKSEDLFNDELDAVAVHATPRGIDLIGSEQSPEGYDVEALPLAQALNPKKHLEALFQKYDFVVIDCPPSLGRRLAGALICADYVICPIKLSGYAVSGLKSLFSTILQIRKRSNRRLKSLGVVVNEFQDTAAQREALLAVSQAIPGLLFKTKVRSRSPIDIASRGKPISEVRNGQRATEELGKFFSEVLKRIKDGD